MRKSIFSWIGLFLSCLICLNTPAAWAVSEQDIEGSEWYYREKAELRDVKKELGFSREVSVSGIVVSDLELAQKLGRVELVKSIQAEQSDNRFLLGAIGGTGITLGVLLMTLTQSQLAQSATSDQQPLFVFNNQVYTSANAGALAGGILGTLLTTVGIYFTIQLLNDLSGLTHRQYLDDKVVEQMVEEYNERLKEKIRSQQIHGRAPYGPAMIQFTKRF